MGGRAFTNILIRTCVHIGQGHIHDRGNGIFTDTSTVIDRLEFYDVLTRLFILVFDVVFLEKSFGRSISKVPLEYLATDTEVLKHDGVGYAHVTQTWRCKFRVVRLQSRTKRRQVKLERRVVAILTSVATPRLGNIVCGKVGRESATAGTHGMIDHSSFIETTGATINMRW